MMNKFEEKKIWENKKSPAFRKWVAEQFCLSPKDRSTDFNLYIDLKSKEGEEKESVERSLEQKRKETFKRYLDILDLTEKELKNKKIADLGCENGEFVVECLEKNITREAYGQDIELSGEALEEKYKNNFQSGSFEEKIPFQNLDYIISVGAITLYLNQENAGKIEKMIRNALAAIGERGQIRIGPVYKAGEGDNFDGIKESEKVLADVLEKIGKDESILWELAPLDIHVSGDYKDVMLRQVLIINKSINFKEKNE